MDDIRIFANAIKEGWRWWDGKLCFCEEWKLEDQKAGLSSTARTARVMVDIMNSIWDFLNFTVEVEDDFADRKLPTLDVRIWVREGLIEYEFFSKPMSANTVLNAKTALGEQTKFSSLSQEVVRRMLHTSRRLEDSSWLESLEDLTQRMTNSDHRPAYIRKVLVAGFTSYQAKLKNSRLPKTHPAYKPLHLDTNFNTKGRWKKKIMAKKNWYQDGKKDGNLTKTRMKKNFQKGGNDKVNMEASTVIFIPSTKGGVLVKMMRDNEKEMAKITRFRVRFQEAGGIQLARMFSTDLAKGDACQRKDCPPCTSKEEKKTNCKQQSVVYESRCSLCNKEESSHLGEKETQREGIYIGETSRSLYERSKEHVEDAKSFKEGSHIVKHWLSSHEEEKEQPEFVFRNISSYKDCLSRQIAEAILINYSKDSLLNSKNEYNSNCLARVTVEETIYEKKRRERKEEEDSLIEKKAWNMFKWSRGAGKRRKEPDLPEAWMGRDGKRPRLDQEENVSTTQSRMGTQAREIMGDLDLGVWLDTMEGICMRAGSLMKRLEKDRERVVRKMDNLEQERILLEMQAWWCTEKEEGNEDPHQDEGLGARHPINKPNSTPRQFEEHAEVQNLQEKRHQHAGKSRSKFGGGKKSDWSTHLTGLVGWWRRIENIQTKQEENDRKTKEKHTKASVAKLSFVSRFFPQTTNTHLAMKTTPTRRHHYFSNTGSRKETPLMNSGLLSPSTKRKGGGVFSEFYSPGKRLKNFRNTLNYWEDKAKTSKLTSGSDTLAEPLVLVLDLDNRIGGSGGVGGGI